MITIPIIIVTALISIAAFRSSKFQGKLLLSPYGIVHRKEWYRLVTHIFVHADYLHLIVNMLVFFSFGIFAENIFNQLKQEGYIASSTLHFCLLYFGGAVISSLTTVNKHKDNIYYQGVGASGGVSAVVFLSIFFEPLNKLLLMGIIPIPAILFVVGYLVYSHYMSKKSADNINHDAHFVGAVFGFIYPVLISPSLFMVFLRELRIF